MLQDCMRNKNLNSNVNAKENAKEIVNNKNAFAATTKQIYVPRAREEETVVQHDKILDG